MENVTDNVEQKEEKRKQQEKAAKEERERWFMKGLYSGVALTFICMVFVVGLSVWRANYRLQRESAAGGKETTQVQLDLDMDRITGKLKMLEEAVNEDFLGEIDAQQVEDTIYGGMLRGLDDPYTEYYSAKQMTDLVESVNGSYAGIGATLMMDMKSGKIIVESCFEDSPAAEAGILPGDIICGINGEEFEEIDLDELVSRIKTEPGETVTLMIQREEEKLELDVERRKIEIPTVNGKILEDGIGYLQITEFDAVTTEQFKNTLKELQDSGMKKLICDLRDNPGGNLDVVCEILDLILPEGLIVYTEDKDGKRVEYSSDAERQIENPMVVLINENSASASEIFAGAIQDYGLGTLVGITTYGKGIVQELFEFEDGSGIKMTTAKYYTPNGNDIHEKGIQPDVEIELPEEAVSPMEISEEQDTQLQEAVRILKEE